MNRILQNMSTPPKSIVWYSGAEIKKESAEISIRHAMEKNKALYLQVQLPNGFKGVSVTTLIKQCASLLSVKNLTKQKLIERISERSLLLPFPSAVPLVEKNIRFLSLKGLDLLASLSFITQSTGFIWLKNRTPDLTKLEKLDSVILCVVPRTMADFDKHFHAEGQDELVYTDS